MEKLWITQRSLYRSAVFFLIICLFGFIRSVQCHSRHVVVEGELEGVAVFTLVVV